MPVHERGVWVHDDLLPANLLVDDAGRLAAVIDFVPGAADPATVCLAAWNVLPASHRARFRAELGLDAAAWWRGIGWAIVQAVVALPYYRRTNAGMTRMARHALRELVAGATPLEPR
jgi:aminoglycoside phosphotransferase (APT) family kinase protein